MPLWTSFNRWLAGPPPARRPSQRRAPSRQRSHATPVADAADLDEIDWRFTAVLVGTTVLRAAPIEPAERDVLDRLEALARAPGDQKLVPRMPALLPRLMSLVRRDDVSAREIAAHFARDPALLGEVIRIANSPRQGLVRPVSDLQQAILLLGQAGLRELLANVVMGPVFNMREGRFSRLGAQRLWQQAERCAEACADFRRDAGDRFDAYLAGMAANVGLIVALRVLDLHYASRTPPDTLAFHTTLRDVNARLSAVIARQWNFPDVVVSALDRRARPRPGAEPGDLVVALLAADGIGKSHVLASVAE